MAIGNIKAAAAAQQQQTTATNPTSQQAADETSLSASFFQSLFPPEEDGQRVPGTDCVIVSRPPVNCTVGVVYGLDGHGKTTFAVGAAREDEQGKMRITVPGCPDPVQVIGMDRRGKEAVYRAQQAGRTIYYLNAAPPSDIASMSHDKAKQVGQYVLDRIIRNYDWAAEQARQGNLRTVCLDTGTVLTNLIRIAISGRPERAKPVKGERNNFPDIERAINFQVAYFVNKAREYKFNLIILSQAKADNWPAPDSYTYDVHKVFSQGADWSARVKLSSIEDKLARAADEAKRTGGELSAGKILQIEKSGHSFELEIGPKSGLVVEELGKTYTAKDWGEDGPFAYACSRLIPRTEPGDWR